MNQEVLWHTPNDRDDVDENAQRAIGLVRECASIEQRQSSWHLLNLWNATLFSNRELPGFRWGAPDADNELEPVDLRTENIIEEIGEAFMSKAASSPLKPSLVPRGQRLDTERAVRIADNFVFGVWRQTEAEEACIQMFLDAYISGLGCVAVNYNTKTNQLHVESVFFDNVIVDNRECAGRAPPRTYRIRRVLPRATVEARYGVTFDDTKPRNHYVDYRPVADGWVVVIEAWRLPDDGKGGWHMVACQDKILEEGEWTHDWVPLVFFKWADNPSGFLGKSGVEQLVPFQNKQNDLNDAIDKVQELICVPRLIANANSMIDVNQFDNEFGRFLLYSGVEPKAFEWRLAAINDLYQERERNRGSAFSHMGMSEAFAGADLDQGNRLDSSAAVRERHNMEDRRNLRRWSRYEKARLNVAQTIIKVLGNEDGASAYSAYYHEGGKVAATKVPFEAIKTLSEDQYSWTMDATPIAAMSPAARRELIRDWVSRGVIKEGSEEARRMESNTNIEREEDMEMASKEDIDLRHIAILEKGDYEAPTIATNTTYGVRRVLDNYHRLKLMEDVSPKDPRLQNHLRWVVAAIAIQKQTLLEQQRQQEQQALQAQAQQPMTPFSPTQGMAGTNSSNGPPMMMAPPQ